MFVDGFDEVLALLEKPKDDEENEENYKPKKKFQ